MLQATNNIEKAALDLAWSTLYRYCTANPGKVIFHVSWVWFKVSVTTDELKSGLQFFFGPPPVEVP
jgi:hypothetical protein